MNWKLFLWIYSQAVVGGTTIILTIFYIAAYIFGYENITLHTNAFNEQLLEIFIFISGLILFIYFFKKRIEKEANEFGDVKDA